MQNSIRPYADLSSNLKTTKHWLLLLTLLFCYAIQTSAQILINVDLNDFVYHPNIDGLSATGNSNNWDNNSTLSGWYAASSRDPQENDMSINVPTYIETYRTDNIGNNPGLYSYGSDDDSDRALGSFTTNKWADIVFGVHFINTGNTDIKSVTISFRSEHWWKSLTSVIGYQRTKVSYSSANSIDLTPHGLFNNDAFIDVPEAYLVSIDTNPADLALNGNNLFAEITVTMPLSIPAGSEFFLRFYDENLSGIDVGLAVDELEVTFSKDVESHITAASDNTVFQYLDMGIVEDIPDKDASPLYVVPTSDHINDWQHILDNFYSGNLDNIDASNYGYEVIEYHDLSTEADYHVLRKQNHSDYFWGTYVKTVNSTSRLIVQSPHAAPGDDTDTGKQGAAVLYMAQAKGLMLSGISRCASGIDNLSLCSGQTKVCSDNNIWEEFRESDLPHEENSIFHLATEILADIDLSLTFVQLHGFEPDDDDPDPQDFVISCGTINAQLKSVPDYPVIVRESLLNSDPDLKIKITHVDTYSELGGQTNVQGRYLNLYSAPLGICKDDTEPETVTNRFLHIEQSLEYRKFPNHYSKVVNALTQAINENTYERGFTFYTASEFDFYFEEFTNFYGDGADHTWGNNLHIQGWYAAATKDNLFTKYHIAHGQLIAGGIYSFGQEGSSDRAFGSIATSPSSSTGDIAYGILFKNSTGGTVYGVNLEYDSEQWRDSKIDGIQTVELSYRIEQEIPLHPAALMDNSNYIRVPEGDLHSSDLGGNDEGLEGDVNPTHIQVTIPVLLNDGEEIFIRFFDADNDWYDKAMAIDNFYATFSSEAPLPVDWRYFNVIKKNGRPLLQWGADNENDCNRYDILRSEDGKSFEILTSLQCKQNPLANQYEYTDYTTHWQRNIYYKIAQYDEDGEVTYSPVRSFNSTGSSKPRVYYQNNELFIDADKEDKLQSVTVMDFMGRRICYGKPAIENNSHYKMECPLPSGQPLIVQLVFDSHTYVVHLRTGDR